MRYLVPAGDNELVVTLRDPNYVYLTEYDRTIFIYIEEDEDAEPELATLRFFETGEAVEGQYMHTLASGKLARHLYWVNAYEIQQKKHDALAGGTEYGPGSDRGGHLREADDMPEV